MRNIKSVTSVALLVLIILVGYFFFGYQSSYIRVTVEDQDFQCLLDSDHFSLRWIHSVEKTPWEEQYIQVNDGFRLQNTTLISFGAGTPEYSQVLKQENGTVTLSVDQYLPEINWVVSNRTRGTIAVDHLSWKVYQQFPDYSVVHLSVQHGSRWDKRGLNHCL